MKILFFVAGGRAGSDFFHSLIDGHTQILQFPGYLRVDKKFGAMLNLNNPNQISDQFIKLYPEFFNSRINKFERHDKLGRKKNRYFKVSKKKFSKCFIRIMKKKNKFSKLEIIKNLHFAYSYSKNEKLNNKKILFIHTHLIEWTRLFIKIVEPKNFQILHIIRHPLASINSPLKTWLRFEDGNGFFPKDLYFQLDLVFNGISDLIKLGKVYILKLEGLHLENNKVMKDFCRTFKIRYENCLKESTKNGLKWWGDAASQKWLNGINKNFEININKKFFYERDLIFFQKLSEKIIEKYKYDFFYPRLNIYFNLLPMRCEILVWKNTIKHFFKSFRWKHFLSIPIFYLIRIILFNKLVLSKNIKYPSNLIG